MLGKSAGRCALALVSMVALSTCAKNVPQDLHTGPDGKVKGAKPITLDAGKDGKATGIVTYPGGDRVDWKTLELPNTGSLSLKLSWVPPRPGLGLGLDVFDEYGKQVASVRGGKKRSTRRSREAELMPAFKGKYFIRVYAPNRGDAGKYTLKVTFNTLSGGGGPMPPIPDPPRLAAVPEAEIPCDPFTWVKTNPACRTVCPNPVDPSWPACQGHCPTPPDINNPACHATMECPNPPDRRVKKCPKTAWPECNPQAKDPQNPNCDGYKPPAVKAKVINVQVAGNGVIITVDRGQDKQVDKGWKGKVMKKGSNKPLEGGDFVVIKVGKRESVGKVNLTADQVTSNPDVILEAP